MASVKAGLSDDQLFTLMKFKRNVADCITESYHDEVWLLRWLKARNFNLMNSEKMLRASVAWRKTWEVEKIANWNIPEVLKKYYPNGSCGIDKDGSPVVVVPFSGLDIWGMLHSLTKEDFIRMTIRELEKFLAIARYQREKYGENANQLVAIFDMTDFNIKDYAWRPAAELIVSLCQMYEANYPEILKSCFIINVPKIFYVAFSVIKNFLNEYTLSKLHFYKSDRSKWEPALLAQINSDQLPVHFGGSLTDPDGNPRCVTMIHQGGVIPKSFYLKKLGKSVNELIDNKYDTANVKKGEKVAIDYIVPEEGYLLKYEFQSDDHDIKFSIKSIDSDGKMEVVVAPHRVACHENQEIGVITCDKPATYKIIFDNSYSILRSKKIRYSITVIPPLTTSINNNENTKIEQ